MYDLLITADTNDGDYVTETNEVSEETLERLKPILSAVKLKHGKWETGQIGDSSGEYTDLLTPDDIDFFDELVPNGEYGIHTIESVVYYPTPTKTTLFSRW